MDENDDYSWISAFIEERAPYAHLVKDLKYMRFYVDAFLGSDCVGLMRSADEVGAYFLLLLAAWKQPLPASLPDDDEKLRRWARVTQSKWSKIRDVVLSPFKLGPDSRLYQKLLCGEWMFAARAYAGRAKGAQITNQIKNAGRDAERPAERTLPLIPNPTRPALPNPSPPNPASDPMAGSGNSVSAVGGRVGNMGREFGQAGDLLEKHALLTKHIRDSEAVQRFANRRDLSLEKIKREIANIQRDPKVSDIGAILIHRFNGGH